ncbi:hypothetical protein EJ06DRAFT_523759 [Trichodelitschia bisporula]|uniref:Uncharacterized protein n=1 Tax=Trichodelitschia bisporula TaxID=703511 RepID=A0A6G1HPV2_9PEZI|nr:hypothetical protein EJ06DRAFT_523759 [Trichodelitschia bisporula]
MAMHKLGPPQPRAAGLLPARPRRRVAEQASRIWIGPGPSVFDRTHSATSFSDWPFTSTGGYESYIAMLDTDYATNGIYRSDKLQPFIDMPWAVAPGWGDMITPASPRPDAQAVFSRHRRTRPPRAFTSTVCHHGAAGWPQQFTTKMCILISIFYPSARQRACWPIGALEHPFFKNPALPSRPDEIPCLAARRVLKHGEGQRQARCSTCSPP